MTQSEKLNRSKMSLLELGEYLKNVSVACRVFGVSRQHFYDLRKAYQEGGMEALREQNRRKPNHKNRVAPETATAASALAEPGLKMPSAHRAPLGAEKLSQTGFFAFLLRLSCCFFLAPDQAVGNLDQAARERVGVVGGDA